MKELQSNIDIKAVVKMEKIQFTLNIIQEVLGRVRPVLE